MSVQSVFERLYEWRWWISLPLITVSVIAGSASRPVAWVVGALIIALIWIPGAFIWTRAVRRAGTAFRDGLREE